MAYVVAEKVDGKLRWVPRRLDGKAAGFYDRARVETELVVDGQVIDLNRIPLPEATPILDQRFERATTQRAR